MNGSEKQIKWAESIKAGMDFAQFLGKGGHKEARTQTL